MEERLNALLAEPGGMSLKEKSLSTLRLTVSKVQIYLRGLNGNYDLINARVQAIWIWLTVAYSFFGAFLSINYVSSLLISFGGLVLAAYFWILNNEEDRSKVNSTTILIIAGSFVLARESWVHFEDRLATIMSLFSAVVGSCYLFCPADALRTRALGIWSGIMVFTVAIVSLTTLHTTVLIREFGKWLQVEHIYIIAPHASAILWSIYGSILIYMKVFDEHLIRNKKLIGLLFAIVIAGANLGMNETRVLATTIDPLLSLFVTLFQSIVFFSLLTIFFNHERPNRKTICLLGVFAGLATLTWDVALLIADQAPLPERIIPRFCFAMLNSICALYAFKLSQKTVEALRLSEPNN